MVDPEMLWRMIFGTTELAATLQMDHARIGVILGNGALRVPNCTQGNDDCVTMSFANDRSTLVIDDILYEVKGQTNQCQWSPIDLKWGDIMLSVADGMCQLLRIPKLLVKDWAYVIKPTDDDDDDDDGEVNMWGFLSILRGYGYYEARGIVGESPRFDAIHHFRHVSFVDLMDDAVALDNYHKAHLQNATGTIIAFHDEQDIDPEDYDLAEILEDPEGYGYPAQIRVNSVRGDYMGHLVLNRAGRVIDTQSDLSKAAIRYVETYHRASEPIVDPVPDLDDLLEWSSAGETPAGAIGQLMRENRSYQLLEYMTKAIGGPERTKVKRYKFNNDGSVYASALDLSQDVPRVVMTLAPAPLRMTFGEPSFHSAINT